MSIEAFTIKNKLFSLTIAVALVVGGFIALNSMGRLEDPEFTIKDAQVITAYPGATPMEVANEVSETLESAVQQLGQLDEIKSYNIPGLSILTVSIKTSYDKSSLPQVWDELRRKVNDAQSELPPGAGPSRVNDDFGDVYGIFLALTSDGYSYKELQDYAKMLRKELLLVKDVAKVAVWGEQREAVYVEISRARMTALGVSINSVLQALQKRNMVSPAGDVLVGDYYIRLQPSGGITSVEGLGDLLIDDPNSSKLVYLKDIATITREEVVPPTTLMRKDGNMSIAMGVSLYSGGNVVELGERVEALVEDLRPQTPVGINIEKVYFQPTYVTQAVDSFVISLVEAVLIVIVVLLFFMGLRSGLLIGAVLVVTICGTFVFMKLWNIDLQRISLGALIIALGMLVDNAIVITEGMLVKIESGVEKLRAAREVVEQNIWPLLGATAIAVLAFAAIGVSQDSTGEYCRSLFQVMFISLFLSWVTAITLTPLFCTMVFKTKPQMDGQAADPYKGIIFVIYKGILTLCLKLRWLTMFVMLGLLAASLYGFGFIQQSFFPESSQPMFYLHYWLPQGTDIRTTSAHMQEIEKTLLEDERVVSVSSFVGAGAPRFMLTYSPENNYSCYGLMLVELQDFTMIDAVMADTGAYIKDNYPAALPKLKKFKLGPGGDAAIQARIIGPDQTVLRQLSEQVKTIMRQDPVAKDIQDDWRQQVMVVVPRIAEAQARMAGVDRPEVSQALLQATEGLRIGVYREGEDLLPILSRLPQAERSDITDLSGVQIWSPTADAFIPISQVVSGFDTVFMDDIVKREDRKMTITVSCDPAEGLASPLFNRLRPAIEALELPTGYALEWGGEYEDSTKAQTALFSKIPMTLALMVLITIGLFNAFRQPLIIWLTVPLALIGVVVGLLAFKQPFGFMALLGFLSLSGMLIKNAIVLIDQMDLEIREGKPRFRAVVDSAVSRMRPVMMAALTTVLGMIPLVVDPFFVAMAVTIMSGLTFASILTLVVVPVLYVLMFRIKSAEV